jgi:NADH-quinone oxidoreductase subunit J
VLQSNPVHSALSLVMTLFSIAVLFIAQDAYFLAAVQVIVYAGAIVVLFLFVIMLLGVDRVENIRIDGLRGQRPAAVVAGIALLALLLTAVGVGGADRITGAAAQGGALDADSDIVVLAKSIFTDYVFAFEVTSLLLVIAVVGAVTLARRPSRDGDGDGGS